MRQAKTRSKSVFVVGAGFSLYAGIPLQMDFTDALLGGRGQASGNSGKIVQHLREFINQAFDHKTSAGAQFWPELEDKELWRVKVFHTRIKFWMEEDVQWVFITDLKLADEVLLVRDEKARCYAIDIATKHRVRKTPCESAFPEKKS